MSHYGTPPPDEPDGPVGPGGQSGEPGSHAAEPAPYNPYPDNWDAPNQGAEAFRAEAPAADPYQAYGAAPVNPYEQPVAPVNPYASTASPDKVTFGFGGYAGWFTRVGAYLVDYLLGLVASIPLVFGYVLLFANADTTTDPQGVQHLHLHQTGLTVGLIGLGALTGLAFQIWNVYIRQGRTGATIGKSVLAIRLVNSDLQPLGIGWCFLRSILHIVDALPCSIGYLWPIWDSKKQTFADKIMNSYVIQATTPQPPPW